MFSLTLRRNSGLIIAHVKEPQLISGDVNTIHKIHVNYIAYVECIKKQNLYKEKKLLYYYEIKIFLNVPEVGIGNVLEVKIEFEFEFSIYEDSNNIIELDWAEADWEAVRLTRHICSRLNYDPDYFSYKNFEGDLSIFEH